MDNPYFDHEWKQSANVYYNMNSHKEQCPSMEMMTGDSTQHEVKLTSYWSRRKYSELSLPEALETT